MKRSNPWWLALLAAAACHDNAASEKTSASATPSASASASAPPAVAASASASASVANDPLAALTAGPSLREQTEITVDGVKETWRLEWTSPPVPDCVDDAFTSCACAGFAYGEKGDLDLVRTRPGQPDDRLHLGPLFEGGKARLMRWSVGPKPPAKPASMLELSMRPLAHVIKLADYDHDGRATEFVLQVGAQACGHAPSIVVGISKSKPTLHAFATSDKPAEPLELDRRGDWDKLASKSPTTVVEVACGDHGADTESSVELSADGELHAKAKTRKCP
jgi:hypothetical protein